MTPRTFAYIACAPHPRVGVTMCARLLADYWRVDGRNFVGFDTDPHEQHFATWFPEQASVVDLSHIQGQIALFDSLLVADGVPKLVDVWSRSWRGFLDLATQIDFFGEARRRGVTPVVLYVADAQAGSLEGAEALLALDADLNMVVVHNEGAASLGPQALDTLARYPAQRVFEIRALDPVIREVVDTPRFSLSDFLLAPSDDMSVVVRAGLRAWLGPIFQQFQSYELRQTLQDSRYL